MQDTQLSEATELASIILSLHRSFIKSLSKHLDEGKISLPQFTLIGYLSQTESMSMTEIARKMNHTTAATTGLVDRLVKAKLVKRFEDESDRRKVMVKISDQGKLIVEKVQQDMAQNILALFNEIGVEDQAAWLRIYRRINSRVYETVSPQ